VFVFRFQPTWHWLSTFGSLTFDMSSCANSRFVSIVDDDASVRRSLEDLLMSVGIPAESFGSAEEFLESNKRYQTACLITDLRMPGMSGLELQRKLATEGSNIPTILMTAHHDAEMRVRALGGDAIAFLCKPFDEGALLQLLCAAMGDTPV
jgi:FixJ family two-component response regulator